MIFAVTSISAFAPPLDADVPVGVTSGSVPLTLLPQTEGALAGVLDGRHGFFVVRTALPPAAPCEAA